ncbi:UbiD family decarboxylase [Streptomyces sp. BE303]|uniref:UbiD family decarboxylase n=1 Tax=Streptomyces sp. BE303 TaxID=3002528 RepID=UPI002E778675|nr:UbiD family decarboxylase [Streptomyces sp. BE303]MED7948961.1 UbiD family decarboxylase [Streptomyces sp. BE303]
MTIYPHPAAETVTAGLSLRAALAGLPVIGRDEPIAREAVAADFAERYSGVPAVGLARPEPAVLYTGVLPDAAGPADATDPPAGPVPPVPSGRPVPPVLLGLYGDEDRVRGWLPGLPRHTTPRSAAALVAAGLPPVRTDTAPCQQVVAGEVDLRELPVLTATPRDAGPYLTAALVHAGDAATGGSALSAHRMLVIGRDRLTVWMVPGRRLGQLHQEAVARGERLPVTVNIGVPPAAMIASAINSRFLPTGSDKLTVAGGLAGAPVGLVPALTQPGATALAESEIVLEGFLDGTLADEALPGSPPDGSLPEFLGYDGRARSGLPVLTVTGVTTRRDPLYQAVIGPGREQSHILGAAGALSVALSLPSAPALHVHDLHFSPAGGGMLLLAVAVRKESAEGDRALAALAEEVVRRHPFVKTVLFTDDDVRIRSAEELLWALTTRANLGADCVELPGHPPVPMDPSQTAEWAGERGGPPEAPARTFVDATTPYRLRTRTERSFRSAQS